MWSVSKTLSLIEDLRNTPCLWDVQFFDYKSRPIKEEAFEVLGKKYDASAIEIEKKIQSLKNQFRREHRKFMEAKRSGTVPRTCRWFGYEGLQFLLQVYESRASRATPNEIEDAVEDDCDPDEAADEVTSDGTVADGSGLDKESSFRRPVLKKKRPHEESIINETFSCIKTLAKSISKRDEFTVYGEHIANKLKYSGRNRSEIAIAQRRIDEICFQLAMGSFSQQSQSGDVDSRENMENSFVIADDTLNSPHSSSSADHYSNDISQNCTVLPVTFTEQNDETESFPATASPESESVICPEYDE